MYVSFGVPLNSFFLMWNPNFTITALQKMRELIKIDEKIKIALFASH